MDKFTFKRSQMDGWMEPTADPGEEFYLASEVDAEHSELIAHNVEAHARIAELEQQLAGVNASIALFMGPDGEQHINRFATAARSLMVSVTK